MKLRLFYQLRVIDSSSCNRKCAANWVYQLDRAETGGVTVWKNKSLRAPRALQREDGPTEWMNCGKYNASASSELKE